MSEPAQDSQNADFPELDDLVQHLAQQPGIERMALALCQHEYDRLREAFVAVVTSPAAMLAYIEKHQLRKPRHVADIDWKTHNGWMEAIADRLLGLDWRDR